MSGFQDHVKTPELMITMLRNPLEVFVSGEQFLFRKETDTLDKATAFLTESMLHGLKTGGV